jgi:hypothetical protein
MLPDELTLAPETAVGTDPVPDEVPPDEPGEREELSYTRAQWHAIANRLPPTHAAFADGLARWLRGLTCRYAELLPLLVPPAWIPDIQAAFQRYEAERRASGSCS